MRCPADLRRCPVKRATRPTLPRVSHSFTSAQASSNASARMSAAAPLPPSAPFHLRAVISPSPCRAGDDAHSQGLLGTRLIACLCAPISAINWLTSYSLYVDTLANGITSSSAPSICSAETRPMHIQEENGFRSPVMLVGQDALSPADPDHGTANVAREDFFAAERPSSMRTRIRPMTSSLS